MAFEAVEDAFKEAVSEGVFPGAVVLAAKGEEIVYHAAFGSRSLVPEKTPMQRDTIFDLASLTKPLATAPAVMLLVREKKIRLDDRVTRFFPNFGLLGKMYVTFRHLLAHCSGLPAWKPYHEDIVRDQKRGRVNFVASGAAKHYVFEQIHREKALSAPGTQTLYSDLGYMLLGEIVEEITGWTLDRYCYDKLFRPSGLRSTSFVDLTQIRSRRLQPIQELIAPTEQCPWRNRILCGEVHDDNAYAMGGVAGHAGLFSNAEDLHRYLLRMRKWLSGGDALFPAPLVEEFLARDETVPGSTFTLGWDTPSAENSSSGSFFSPRSVGHLGFTGTSIWWDREKDRHVILLTNRVHPSRQNDKIKGFRPHIHNLIMKTVLQ
jgi:CubicO group peptidase (beta-lactamase class C family)